MATRESEQRYRTMRLEELRPAEYNPRVRLQPGSRDYEDLKRSIQTFGQVDPLIWNERTQTLVGGHQRLQVMSDMGFDTAEVRVVDLDAEREKVLNLALNKIQGDWDFQMLNELLTSIEEPEMRRIAGFEEGEAAEMIRVNELEFMTNFLDAPEDPLGALSPTGEPREKAGPGAAELKDDHPHRLGVQYFSVELVFTREQRDLYYECVATAKRVNHYDTTMDAVAAILSHYRETHMDDGG